MTRFGTLCAPSATTIAPSACASAEISPTSEIVKTVPHVAFEVEDLEAELEGRNIIIEPNSPSPGIVVAFIEDNGAPIEFLQVEKQEESWSTHRR